MYKLQLAALAQRDGQRRLDAKTDKLKRDRVTRDVVEEAFQVAVDTCFEKLYDDENEED